MKAHMIAASACHAGSFVAQQEQLPLIISLPTSTYPAGSCTSAVSDQKRCVVGPLWTRAVIASADAPLPASPAPLTEPRGTAASRKASSSLLSTSRFESCRRVHDVPVVTGAAVAVGFAVDAAVVVPPPLPPPPLLPPLTATAWTTCPRELNTMLTSVPSGEYK